MNGQHCLILPHKNSDKFGKWGELGASPRMRDSEAWTSVLAIVRMLANKLKKERFIMR